MKHPQVNASLKENGSLGENLLPKKKQKKAAEKAQRYAIFKTNIDKKKQILENK